MSAMLSTSIGTIPWSRPPVALHTAGLGDSSRLLRERIEALHAAPPPSMQTDTVESELSGRLFNLSSKLKVMTSQVSMHLPDDWRKHLFKNLDRLLDPDNWDDADTLIEPESFFTFLRLMLLKGPMCGMALGVSPAGHVLAGWVQDGLSLTLEFIGGDEVRWSVVRHVGKRRESAAGRAPIERLRAVLAPYDPPIWPGHDDTIPT